MKLKPRGVVTEWQGGFQQVIATLYDSMHRNTFLREEPNIRKKHLHRYIRGYSQSAKLYPERLTHYLKHHYKGRVENGSGLTEFIDFLVDLSVVDGSVNSWLVPAYLPVNQCDNPKIVGIIGKKSEGERETVLTMSEIQTKSILRSTPPGESSCRTCVFDRHVKKTENNISALEHTRYKPTVCSMRPDLESTKSGFEIDLSTNYRGVLRIEKIHMHERMKTQFLRLARVRDLDIVDRLNSSGLIPDLVDAEMASSLNKCIVELKFNKDIDPGFIGAEQIWSRSGYRSVIKRQYTEDNEPISIEDKFKEIRHLVEDIVSVCNPARHSDLGRLFREDVNSVTSDDYWENWPPLYLECSTVFLGEIRSVSSSRDDKVGVLEHVPFLLTKTPTSEEITVTIDPIAFWR